MRKFLLSSSAVFVLGASSGLAADLPAYEAPAPVAPIVTPPLWTGFYAGVQLGLGFDHNDSGCFDGTADLFDATLPDVAGDDTIGEVDVGCSDFDALVLPGNAPGGTGFSPFSSDDDEDLNFLAGAHIGADWQMGSFVLGGVLDGSWMHSSSSSASGSYDEDLYEFDGPPFNGVLPLGSVATVGGVQVIEDNDLTFPGGAGEEEPVDPRTDWSTGSDGPDWYGTLRARAGFAFGRALIYATGGLAFGDTGSTSYDVTEYYTGRERNEADALGPGALPANCASAPVVGTTSPGAICTYSGGDGDDWSWGWALGAGVDFLATERFSVGLEYLFVNLDDTDDVEFTSLSGDTITFDGRNNDFHTITLRASYRFGG